MRYYKQISDGTIISIGTGPGGTEITEAEYNALLSEIREKAALVDKLYSGEITIDEVPADWQEEIHRRVDERIAAEGSAEGQDISASAVSGSTVSITNVTGNITITCAAVITNIIDTIGISANTRLSTSSGDNRTQSGYAAIGANKDAASLIHLVAGDTLRIKGASLPASNDNYSAIALYNADGTFNVATYLHNDMNWNNLTFSNSGDTVVVTASAERYFRVSLICANADAVIATINEEINEP